MTKAAVVHAQQRWEYRSLTKQTENYLVTELNEAGKLGWELVSVSFNKDLKGIWSWTAFLKRPLAQPSDTASTQEARKSKPVDAVEGFDLSGEEFGFKA